MFRHPFLWMNRCSYFVILLFSHLIFSDFNCFTSHFTFFNFQFPISVFLLMLVLCLFRSLKSIVIKKYILKSYVQVYHEKLHYRIVVDDTVFVDESAQLFCYSTTFRLISTNLICHTSPNSSYVFLLSFFLTIKKVVYFPF